MNVLGFTQSRRTLPTIAATIALLVIPMAIAIEKSEPVTWKDRIVFPNFVEKENLHTPREFYGTFLPPTLSTSQILESTDSPIILTGVTTIPKNTTLTLNPGTEIFAHEYAALIVEGTLIVNGSSNNDVTFTTNERHPSNQSWSGIIFRPDGQGTIQNAHIKYGSPAITCTPNSAVVIEDTTIELGNVGLFTQTPNCSLSHSVISSVDVGIISFQKDPSLLKTAITARDEAVRLIESTSLSANSQL